MITSSSISYISEMLDEPQNITDADAESIRELTETYPYFTPVRYMQAAQQHKLEPFTPEMMSTMQLFSGNWLLYSEYLQAALGGADIEFEAPAEQSTRKKQAVHTEVEDDLPEDIIEESTEPATVNEAHITGPEPTVTEDEEITPPVSKDIPAEDFNPVNTGFIRGKRSETPPPPAVEEEVAEEHRTEDEPVIAKTPEPAEAVAEDELVAAEPAKPTNRKDWDEKSENLIPPIYTEDYFLHQGMHVSNDLPQDIGNPDHTMNMPEPDKSLMVVMSFSEWLMFYKKKKQQAQEEEQDQRELKTMWQKEKLAAALEEENDEIPENVFEMAVNSITKEDNLASESLAGVMVKQGRYDRAIEMYKKLSLQKPQKKAYFARKIEEIL